MASVTATIQLDLSGVGAHWTAAKAAMRAVPPLLTAVDQAVPTVTFAAAAGPAGTVTFTSNATELRDRVAALRSKLGEALAEVDMVDTLLGAGLPVTVSQVT